MPESIASTKRLVAACGKGGTGKTVLTAMMAKVLLEADDPTKLLLIDADPAMGLLGALGMSARRTMGQIRASKDEIACVWEFKIEE